MLSLALSALSTLRSSTRSRVDLLLEIVALRQQLEIYRRQVRRPRLRRADRLFWIWLCRHWTRWRSALVIVKPETVLRWHREGFRRHWRRISRGRPGRRPLSAEIVAIIERMSRENPTWGEDRIALELKLKLGIEVASSTVRRHLVRPPGPHPSNWSVFIASHASQVFALDFTTQFLWDYSLCHVLAIMAVDTRRIVHIAMTRHPTLDWVKQQIREATPFGVIPRYLIHDNDGIFGQLGRCAVPPERTPARSYRCSLDAWLDGVLAIKGLPIPYGAPNANPHIERFWRTLREECLRRFIFLSEGHLRRTVGAYMRYYNGGRVHQGIEGIPEPEPGALASSEAVVDARRVESRPVLGGLIRDYRLAA